MAAYLRYFLMPLFLVATTVGFMWAGGWMWTGYVLGVVLVIGGDAVAGDDLSVPAYRYKGLLDLSLYLNFPLQILLLAALAWMCAAGGDSLGLGGFVHAWLGWDMQAARAGTGPMDMLGAVLSAGLMIATSATNVGHELVHRTRDRLAVALGRWMLAMSSDTSFSVEHVYGHHRYVATERDPATARRGESVYPFILRSVIGQSRSAWQLEKERLGRRGISVWSWHSRMPRGIAMSALYFLGFFWIGGWTGVLVFLGVTVWSRSLLEFVNYLEHYGLVRTPGSAVKPHHSWNSNKRISALVLYNLPRHSHHHTQGGLPFYRLRPSPDAPTLHFGYLATIAIAMVPPLWHRLMIPKLKEWDERYASPEERRLAAAQNAASGLRGLMPPGRAVVPP